MKILDENNVVIESPNLAKGYLISDQSLIAHHEATEAIEEQGHFVTLAEYSNGGKDVQWIVDVPGVKASEAWDEYEDIQRYVRYTEKELAEHEIEILKQQLNDTDYVTIKIIEGAGTIEQYADIIALRAEWRAQINMLEKCIMEG